MNMLKKAIIFGLFLFAAYAEAAVDVYQAKEVFQGEYKMKDPVTGQIIKFSIDGETRLELMPNDIYYESEAKIISLPSDLGPDGLSVLYIALSGGSDEQTYDLHLRLIPTQSNKGIVLKLADMMALENDGPNGWAFAELSRKKELLKKNELSRNFEKLPVLK